MHDKNNSAQNEGDHVTDDWLASVARHFLHPIQLQIVDALWNSDRSLSANDLAKALEGPEAVTIAYQLRGLRRLGAVAYADTQASRKRLEIRYRLVKDFEQDERR